ncbi:hypothetical protein A3K63_03190 [Candidatus Micrarchaeota archaeon RBG_16_49_10]|nr:MAG: hypothetical protein A3K63_03190 [Candidatus Micrarchaeota archaeon RBG_16_49_10]
MGKLVKIQGFDAFNAYQRYSRILKNVAKHPEIGHIALFHGAPWCEDCSYVVPIYENFARNYGVDGSREYHFSKAPENYRNNPITFYSVQVTNDRREWKDQEEVQIANQPHGRMRTIPFMFENHPKILILPTITRLHAFSPGIVLPTDTRIPMFPRDETITVLDIYDVVTAYLDYARRSKES